MFLVLWSFASFGQALDPSDVPIEDSVEEGVFKSDNPTNPPANDFSEEDDEDDSDLYSEEEVPTGNDTDDLPLVDSDSEEDLEPTLKTEIAPKIKTDEQEFKNTEAVELDRVKAPTVPHISTRNFDPSTIRPPGQREVRKIKHPYSQRGLKKINRNNEYIYAVKPSKKTGASNVMIGTFAPDTFKGTAEAGGQAVNFSDVYDSAISVTVDFEWWKKESSLGTFALKWGSGLIYSTGKGLFTDTGQQSQEEFVFLMFPNTISAAYRAKFWGTQPIIPYVEGGAGYWTFAELRVDDSRSKFAGAITYFGAAGVSFDLSAFAEDSILVMDRDYGINSVHFNLEYKIVDGAAPFEISYNTINAGFFFEY